MNKTKDLESSIKGTASTVLRVLTAVWPDHKGLIIAFFFIALFVSFAPFISSGAQAILINELIANGQNGVTVTIAWVLALIVLVSLLRDVLGQLRRLVNKRLWMRLTEFFELSMLKKRSELDVATYESPKFNDLLNKTSEKGIWPICNLVESQFQQVTNIAQVITAAAVFLIFDWRFFVLAVCSAAPDFIVQLKYGKSSWDIWDEDSQTRRKLSSIRRHFMGINRLIELKIFQNATKFYRLAESMFKGFSAKQWKLETTAFKWRICAGLVSLVFHSVIYAWIIWQVANGELQIGTMTFLLGALGSFEGALVGFFSNLAYQFEWSLYAKDMFKVFDTAPLIVSHENAITVSADVPPRIEFQNVSFAYPNTERLILKNINLTITAGERLAIVGLNGAGKSTLIKLIMRFYEPTGGAILVNGIDLCQLDRESWWSVIAALFQDYAEYNFPVREVIALGRSNGKGYLTKVVRCAKAVDAHSFIVDFKHRYDQMIGKEFDDGIDLSVGQSQKIALARCFYRDPRLLILDEPTASIDAQAEAMIFEQLDKESGGRTQIVISHRFSTVRRSDRICVLEDGMVSELGTHEELMAGNRTYARLFRLQAKGYE
ncbi:MAG: ABC transporter ATP-binding protein [bacterium]|nr:ABC transporter ATP-binding protein [bacterium]